MPIRWFLSAFAFLHLAMAYPLQPCPRAPNCVSSDSRDTSHFVAPIPYTGTRDAALDRIAAVIGQMPRATIVERRPGYLCAEFRSLVFRFVDDVEIAAPDDESVLHFRSAARSGRRDFGVNRRRMQEIARRFATARS